MKRRSPRPHKPEIEFMTEASSPSSSQSDSVPTHLEYLLQCDQCQYNFDSREQYQSHFVNAKHLQCKRNRGFLTDEEEHIVCRVSLKRLPVQPATSPVLRRLPQPQVDPDQTNDNKIVQEMRELIRETRESIKKK